MMVVKMEEGLDRVAAATYAWGATAMPMLSGTLVTIAGFLPVGFARSTAGEYAGNIFWMVAFALLTSWFVAVTFTPYLGVNLLPKIRPVPGGRDAIYGTKNYGRLRRLVRASVDHKWIAAGVTAILFALAFVGMGAVEKQFFPNSDRTELIVEVNMPQGTAFGVTEATVKRIERAIRAEPEAKIVTSYVGQGLPRFILSLDPELPDPAYAAIVVQTPNDEARDSLKLKLRKMVAEGRFPEALVRVNQFVFGPPVRYPVLFRIVGPDLAETRKIANQVRGVMADNPNLRLVHLDWGERTPNLHVVLDEERLSQIGLTPREAGLQLSTVLNGTPATQVREGLRVVDVLVRAPSIERYSLENIDDITLTNLEGRSIPLSQVGHLESRTENAVLKRYDRENYISVEGDVVDGKQPPDITAEILPVLEPIKTSRVARPTPRLWSSSQSC
jgi:multidrug efflux pump subunit AcrB